MSRLRFSTSTLLAGEQLVPWLASAGKLAYSPQSPPERDYYFQYSCVIPGIFCPGTGGRLHRWFGSPIKDCPQVRLLFAFWNRARQAEVDALYVSNGMTGREDLTAPLAVYRHSEVWPSMRERLILIQHGSYLIADVESQPYIDRGEALLYRGIQNAEVFLFRRLATPDVRSRLMSVHARTWQIPSPRLMPYIAIYRGQKRDRSTIVALFLKAFAGSQGLSLNLRSCHCFIPDTRLRNGAPPGSSDPTT